MTAPSLYQQEMAKRGIVIPKATGCPRKAISMIVTAPKPERRELTVKRDRTEWNEWADLYRNGLTLTEIGQSYGVSFQHVSYALSMLNVPRRKRGYGHVQNRMAQQMEALRKENQLLRMRLAGLRRKYKEAA